MGVESPVAGQGFSSSFFARVRAKNEEIKHISDRKKLKKKKKAFLYSEEKHKILCEDLVS